MQSDISNFMDDKENIEEYTMILSKKEKWVQKPIREPQCDLGYRLYNMYTCMLPKGKEVTVSSGLVAPDTLDKLIFVLGVPQTNFNRNIEVTRNFIGCGEIDFKCVNYGECDFELYPLTKLTEFVVLKVAKGDPIVCDSLDDSARGNSGFGSTGVK